jgi:signal transduction histidine kinase
MTAADQHLSALWLSTLQRLTERVAHEIRNALNGVAVNVEVVRSRATRAGDTSAIAPFATAAASQVEILAGQVDALVSMLRPPTTPLDLGALLGRMVILVRGEAGKAEIELDLPVSAGAAVSGAPGDATRLAVAAALLAALDRDCGVTCRLGTDAAPTVYISCDAGGPLTLADEVAKRVTRAGILLTPSAHGIVLTFPPASGIDGFR